jgi:hypothetical protein
MKHNLLLVFIPLIVFVLGLLLKSSTELGFCLISEPTCINNLTNIGNALYYGAGALTIVALVLLATPQAYSAWKKFAIWFVPLTALLFVFYPGPGAGDLFSPYPETVYKWVSTLYVAVSLLIIGLQRMKQKKV